MPHNKGQIRCANSDEVGIICCLAQLRDYFYAYLRVTNTYQHYAFSFVGIYAATGNFHLMPQLAV